MQPLVNLEPVSTTKLYLTDRDTGNQPQDSGAKSLNLSNLLFEPTNNNNNNNIDNLNVIYDNDTSLAEQAPNKQLAQQATGVLLTPEFIGSDAKAEISKQLPAKPLNQFVNRDRNEEFEQENYATCLFESNLTNGTSLVGRINFWQAINNRGVLHLLARLRYELKTNTLISGNSSMKHAVNKRESFRTLVEKTPSDGADELAAGRQPIKPKHQLWLIESNLECQSERAALQLSKRRLLAELSSAFSTMSQKLNTVDIDAELAIGQFNLTGSNDLINRWLVFSLPDGSPIGCCRVTQSSIMPASELDSLPSVNVVQPIKESLLPIKQQLGEIGNVRASKKEEAEEEEEKRSAKIIN